MWRRLLGARGEELAARHLEKLGCRILDRGWRTKTGEIDLVAEDGGEIVFVEVKTRTDSAFGPPEEAVTFAKRRKLRNTAAAYLARHRLRDRPYRIDVIAITSTSAGTRLDHFRSAVEEG